MGPDALFFEVVTLFKVLHKICHLSFGPPLLSLLRPALYDCWTALLHDMGLYIYIYMQNRQPFFLRRSGFTKFEGLGPFLVYHFSWGKMTNKKANLVNLGGVGWGVWNWRWIYTCPTKMASLNDNHHNNLNQNTSTNTTINKHNNQQHNKNQHDTYIQPYLHTTTETTRLAEQPQQPEPKTQQESKQPEQQPQQWIATSTPATRTTTTSLNHHFSLQEKIGRIFLSRENFASEGYFPLKIAFPFPQKGQFSDEMKGLRKIWLSPARDNLPQAMFFASKDVMGNTNTTTRNTRTTNTMPTYKHIYTYNHSNQISQATTKIWSLNTARTEKKKRTPPPPKENHLGNFPGLKEKLSRPVVDT